VRKLSLAFRILLFWFVSTLAVLVVAGVLFVHLHSQHRKDDIQQALDGGLQHLDAKIEYRADELQSASDALVKNGKLQATLNLFHNYFQSEAGNPALFDHPAKELATMLGASAHASSADWLVVSGQHGPIAAYVDQKLLFWSHDEEEQNVVMSSDAPGAPFRRLPSAPGLPEHGVTNEKPVLTTCLNRRGIALNSRQQVRSPAGGVIGHVSLGRCLDQQFIDALALETGLSLTIESPEDQRSSRLPADFAPPQGQGLTQEIQKPYR